MRCRARERESLRSKLREAEGRLITVQSYMRAQGLSVEVLPDGDLQFSVLRKAPVVGNNKP